MLGSVSLPSASTIEQSIALIQVLSDAKQALEMLEQYKKQVADIAARQKDMDKREKLMAERERAVKIREDNVATEESRLADGHSKVKASQADLDRRLGIMKQAMG